MPRLQIVSDLHLEFFTGTVHAGAATIAPAPDADLLVLAGDIARSDRAVTIFDQWPVPVLYVAGNHEYYRHEYGAVNALLASSAAQSKNVHFLERSAITIAGVRFLGTTLWTDYQIQGDREAAMRAAEEQMFDHRLIRFNNQIFAPMHALDIHMESRKWLEQQLDSPFSGKTVVITHHGPSAQSIHSQYEGNALNPAFSSDLRHLVEKADCWIHGHTHMSLDYRIGKARVVVNPRGYPENKMEPDFGKVRFENVDFDAGLVIDI